MIRVEKVFIELPGFSLRDIDLEVREREFFILMGPTGAGKTVLLEGIAGLLPLKSGRIFIGDREVTRLPPEKRGISIVYQDHALFPHLTVRENINYGLHFHRVDREESEKRFRRLVDGLNISQILERLPLNLSGGEKQRVALARALIVDPKVVLLDEPLSALDPAFREGVRNALKRLQQTSRTTFLMVTHDFAEALALASRAAVINGGTIEQTGTIEDIFQRPGSTFVADFVGMKNVFEGEFLDGMAMVQGLDIRLDEGMQNGRCHVAIRPEDIMVKRDRPPADTPNSFEGKVVRILDLGFTYEVQVGVGEVIFRSLMTKKTLFKLGMREELPVFVSFRPEDVHTF